MPDYIIKVDPDRDLYAVFSTVVDNFTWMGTRAELEAYPEYDTSQERMARVEERGLAGGGQRLFGAGNPCSGARRFG